MGIVDDVLKAFDRIPIWKRLQEIPRELDELKARIAAIEEKQGGKWPGNVCPFCGAQAVRLKAGRYGRTCCTNHYRETFKCCWSP